MSSELSAQLAITRMREQRNEGGCQDTTHERNLEEIQVKIQITSKGENAASSELGGRGESCESQINSTASNPGTTSIEHLHELDEPTLPQNDAAMTEGTDNQHQPGGSQIENNTNSDTIEEPAQPTSTPNAVQYPYKKVHAMLISWEEHDNPGMPGMYDSMEQEIASLEMVLRAQCHFETALCTLPSDHPQEYAEKALTDYQLGFDDDENLLIVYYHGHSGLDEGRRSLQLAAWSTRSGREGRSPEFSWSSIHSRLRCLSSDVLIILDCCESAAAIFSADSQRRRNRMEMIVGSGFPGTTYGFNQELVRVLSHKINQREQFTVSELYQALLEMVLLNNVKHLLSGVGRDPPATPIYINFNSATQTSIPVQRLAKVPEPSIWNLEGTRCAYFDSRDKINDEIRIK